jgi:hypothetical protein
MKNLGRGVVPYRLLRVLRVPTSAPPVLSPFLPLADVPNCPLHDYYGMEENWIPRRASQSPQSTQPAGKGLSQTEWHSVQDQRMTS